MLDSKDLKELYEFVKHHCDKSRFLSRSTTFSKMYEHTDLVNDVFLEVSSKEFKNTLELIKAIEQSIKVNTIAKYRNARDPYLFADHFTKAPKKEWSNPGLECILIKEANERLKQLFPNREYHKNNV